MKAFLLDANVLVAMSWPGHRFHATALRWFASSQSRGWATCPLVQTAFVRIVSNPSFSPRFVSPREAIEALNGSIQHPRHQFWADDLSAPEALGMLIGHIAGHQQVTDAYLVALAVKHGGKLATLDKRIAHLAPADAVELIS
jgi:uncharacterized protein